MAQLERRDGGRDVKIYGCDAAIDGAYMGRNATIGEARWGVMLELTGG